MKLKPIEEPVTNLHVIATGGPAYEIVNIFPKVFQSNGVKCIAKYIPSSEVPTNPAQLWEVFGDKAGAILLIKPITSTTSCNWGSCVSKYELHTKLIDSKSGETIWMSDSQLPYPTTYLSDYSGVAEKFALSTYETMKKEGLLGGVAPTTGK
jgi:hypothetical protein